jgi:hypothetical protein
VTETNVFQLTQPGTFSDPLTEVLRNGARTLLQAIEAEVAAWLSTHTDKLTDDGRRRLVRHGRLPEREIMTGIGAVRYGARASVTASAKAEGASDFRRRLCLRPRARADARPARVRGIARLSGTRRRARRY